MGRGEFGFRGRSVFTVTSHEVAHCLGLEHAKYRGATGFEAARDGLMGWEPDEDEPFSCKKAWFDLVRAHQSPDRFSYQDILKLRRDATD